MEKIMRARKPYQCDCCENIIFVGDHYLFGNGREPKCDKDDEQYGIQYYQFRLCVNCYDPRYIKTDKKNIRGGL